ncbi:hypothetical protein SAMN02745671_02512 [Anaerovibrio lipolyticus DSM 3074]|uniref:Uncharacterized protein n=1 Tax=Anaerovibrio lipolyticus DSM 3074 TaxID=1120997 RepID=A0A1M6G4G6_9FIRM|nr:hypothetical protein SAMN02745671_02512 [Anaerovibrio lipolyticus DSM 3074]
MYIKIILIPQQWLWFDELYFEAVKIPPVGVNSVDVVFKIQWGHNKLIMDKCKYETEKALFYVQESIQNGWYIWT